MVNDSASIIFGVDPDSTLKSPRKSSLAFIRQFARAYSEIKGMDCSYCILN